MSISVRVALSSLVESNRQSSVKASKTKGRSLLRLLEQKLSYLSRRERIRKRKRRKRLLKSKDILETKALVDALASKAKYFFDNLKGKKSTFIDSCGVLSEVGKSSAKLEASKSLIVPFTKKHSISDSYLSFSSPVVSSFRNLNESILSKGHAVGGTKRGDSIRPKRFRGSRLASWLCESIKLDYRHKVSLAF